MIHIRGGKLDRILGHLTLLLLILGFTLIINCYVGQVGDVKTLNKEKEVKTP